MVCIGAVACPAWAALNAGDGIDAQKQFDFANRYLADREYMLAIIEFNRFIYFYPEDERVGRAEFNIASCYFYLEQIEKALQKLRWFIGRHPKSPDVGRAFLMISDCQAKRNKKDLAARILLELTAGKADAETTSEAYFRLGILQAEAGQWDEAGRYFLKIDSNFRDRYGVRGIIENLSRVPDIPRKSPVLAGLFALIPGAGYLYCQRYQDALIAAFLNLGLILAGVESFENDLHTIGTLISVVGLGFYSGSIYGSVSSAHKYNRSQTRTFIENLKQNSRLRIKTSKPGHNISICLNVLF